MSAATLARAVIHELQRRNDPATASPTWPAVAAVIRDNPHPFARALGLLPATPRERRTVH
ncbi:MAG: hypothetical protein AB9M53_06665 [Leptothrix sp. (in: b-proteobacteria)]